METRNSKNRTLIIGTVAGIVVAAAMGAAFMLGGQTGDPDDNTDGRPSVQISPTTGATRQTTEVSASNQAPGAQPASHSIGSSPAGDGWQSGDGGQEEPVVSQTAVPEDEEEESPTDTPTATPTATPWGPDDVAAEPTATSTPDPCPLCDDLDLAVPVDMEPEITNIETSFCFPNLVMKFDLQYADVVWFTYSENGITYHSEHIDADTFLGFLSEDVGFLDWNVLFIDNIHIHATDIQDNHTISDEIPRPEMEFC